MSAGPITMSIFVFFVVVFCGQVLAAGQQRLFSPTDQPVSVVGTQSQGSAAGSSGIKSCLSSASPPRSFRVRFQKLKGRTATFTRTLLNSGLIGYYASKMKSVSMPNIANCVNVAETEGFVGFSFNGGTCGLFKMEYQSCGCEIAAQDVFFVQASFWDPKDSTLPQIVLNVEYGITKGTAVVHLPNTVYDWKHLFPSRTNYNGLQTVTSLDEQNRRGCGQSEAMNCVCTGLECVSTYPIDILHCVPKSCAAPGNTTVLQVISFGPGPSIVKNFYPFLFILSECGKTIILEPSPYIGNARAYRVMSHQGYGCKWYPKTGKEHECVVTFASGNLTSSSTIFKWDMVLDGNTTTCEGDTLSLHVGAPTNSSLLKRWDACATSKFETSLSGTTGNVTFVFRRTAKQYQTDGFNWGFSMMFIITIGP